MILSVGSKSKGQIIKKLTSLLFVVFFLGSLPLRAGTYDYYFHIAPMSNAERTAEVLKQVTFLVASCSFGAGTTAASAVWRTLPVIPAVYDDVVFQRSDIDKLEYAGGLISLMDDILYSGITHFTFVQRAYRRTRENIEDRLTSPSSECQTAFSNLRTLKEFKDHYLERVARGPGENNDSRESGKRPDQVIHHKHHSSKASGR